MLRLIAYVEGGARRFPILRQELFMGRHPECDICLPYAGVAERHARLWLEEGRVQIEDLGTRRGVLINGQRIRRATVEVLDEIRLGTASLLLEEVERETLHTAEREHAAAAAGPPRIDADGLLRHLAEVSRWVLADASSRATLESLITSLLEDFGGGALFLLQAGHEERQVVRFAVATEVIWLGTGEVLWEAVRRSSGGRGPAKGEMTSFEMEAQENRPAVWVFASAFLGLDRAYLLTLALPRFRPGEWCPGPGFRVLGELLVQGLVHHVGRFEPLLPGHAGRAELNLEPRLVLGESKATQALLEQLAAAVDPPVTVLLQGEPGSGRELMARSLHRSGARRHGPFAVASCGGASGQQIEADLFGAELPGRGEPLRREGKLVLADGGTLFLAGVEELPLDLQGRLVRFLRTGEVEAAGSLASRPSDVRLIASSRGPLEPSVASGAFRIDLAYRLAEASIRVPALRQRKEDLPLLVQAAVNRFCHEAGKRVQGITLPAMNLLISYDYPGNLPELDSIVRQLVHLCPPGQPVDTAHLPRRVRTASLREQARVDTDSDLNLDGLVRACEQAAIREALRRTRGNRSEAARLLGLSRNGLALKMRRYGIA